MLEHLLGYISGFVGLYLVSSMEVCSSCVPDYHKYIVSDNVTDVQFVLDNLLKSEKIL